MIFEKGYIAIMRSIAGHTTLRVNHTLQ